MLINRQLSKALLCAAVLVGTAFASSPQWFRDAAKTPLGTYEPSTEAVVLLDEQITTVTDNGEVRTTYRLVKKILTAHGRDEGTIGVPYDNETKLVSVRGWSLPVAGNEYELKEKDAYEVSTSTYEVYSDERAKILNLPADVGSIIGIEYEQKGRPYVMADTWSYQKKIPVVTARYTLVLPPNWEMQNFWVNHPKTEPVRNGNSFTWQETNVAAVKQEDAMPSIRAIAPRMEVAFISSSGKGERSQTSWADVGSWYYKLSFSQRQPSAAIQTTATKLIAGKATFLEKVRAIASFAQKDVRYAAIEIGIGGYQPHTVDSILSNRYGDCKDKAALMSSLLQAAGIDSYMVSVHTARGTVFPQAPTARTFNHAIIAVKIPSGETLPSSFQAVVKHPTLGPLLVFDPTDDLTPLGQLPDYAGANYVLMEQEKGSELFQIPVPAPETNTLSRTAKLTLSPEGLLSGQVREVRTGVEASGKRAELRVMQVTERRKVFESFLANFLSGSSLKDFSVENLDDLDKDLVLTYTFEAPDYSKKMGPLMLVRPRVFGSNTPGIDFLKKERKYPFFFNSSSAQFDEFDITLPAGLIVDELPPPMRVSDGPLSYESTTAFAGQTLTYKRSYRVGDVTFAPEKREDLLRFYSKVSQDERSSAVLKKQ